MSKPKNIINKPEDSVNESIEGLLLQYPNHLVRLEAHDNVVLCAAIAREAPAMTVALLSGGGSGHEPIHAGWIGKGMLTGAICGGIFASPSVASIRAAIRAVSSKALAGCLLIVKNYTGDRLNFGMAAEQFACSSSVPVKMVVVADDCSLPRRKGITGARGVAGTVLVHKIAGAAAAAGKSLEQVASIAQQAASSMGTLGIALSSVTVPGAKQVNDRIDDLSIEVGLGIHGEAGLKQVPLMTADEMAREMISTIQQYGRVTTTSQGEEEIVPLFRTGDQLCILVNNLGGTSNFEMSILARSCVKLLESAEYGAKVTHIYVGSYMTSFDMRGVSLTILNVSGNKAIIQLLDAPTSATAWKQCDVWQPVNDLPRPSSIPHAEVPEDEAAGHDVGNLPRLILDGFQVNAINCLRSAAQNLADAEPLLTQYDTIVGDADCGITMQRGANEVLKRLNVGSIRTEHPATLFADVADAISESMGGTSGVLLEILFRKMSSSCSHGLSEVGAQELCIAFSDGVNAVSLYGGAKIGSRTMMDALIPAATALSDTMHVSRAAEAARIGADSTAAMRIATAGRSNYLSEETLEGTPDPGAVAVAIVLESIP